jgi:NhaC family Na+:H+ antiporter
VHPILLLAPLLVIVMVVKKIPPLPALLAGTLLGGIFAMVTQSSSLAEVISAAHSGFVSQTGVEMVDDLLTRGGLQSMMDTVALIICALSFGGIMEKTGMLEVLARAFLKRVRRTGSLVATTIFSSIGMNAIASDQYMAIVIPGRMYKNAFDSREGCTRMPLTPGVSTLKTCPAVWKMPERSLLRSFPGTAAVLSCMPP